jgi:hypothetical protein
MPYSHSWIGEHRPGGGIRKKDQDQFSISPSVEGTLLEFQIHDGDGRVGGDVTDQVYSQDNRGIDLIFKSFENVGHLCIAVAV